LVAVHSLGIVVVVAVEIGLVSRVRCNTGFEMFLSDASHLVAFPRERLVLDEQRGFTHWYLLGV